MINEHHCDYKACLFNLAAGNACILGDPRGDHVKVEGFTQRQVKGKEVLASDETTLALKLMDLFFSREDMARSNCTPAEGRELLRQDIIAGIRSMYILLL